MTNFLQDITDDIKDFTDDELVDRGRDTERDLRRAGRNWFDDDEDDEDDDRYRARRRRRGRPRDDEEIDELRDAIMKLSKKVRELDDSKGSSSRTK